MARKKITWPLIRERTHSSTGKRLWEVDASSNGKRERRYFQTLKEAEVWQAEKNTERENLGTSMFNLPDDLRAEAVELNARLKLVGHTLTSAVEFFFKHARPASQQKLIKEVIAEALAKRESAGRSKEYLRIQASVLNNFAKTFGESPIHTVLSHDIEQWIDSNIHWKPETKRNYIKDLKSLWNFALKNNYVPENPLTRLEKPTVANVAPGILTPKQATDLLNRAALIKNESSMLPFVAIGLFAGLRSAEVCRLDWKEIDLDAKLIEVAGEKAKTRQRRHVQISDNLAMWLEPYRQTSGKVVPCERPEGALGRLAKAAGIAPWPKNALRHSFASYHLASYSDAARTALELGHNSQDLLFKNYRQLVKPAQAQQFWNIVPTQEAAK